MSAAASPLVCLTRRRRAVAGAALCLLPLSATSAALARQEPTASAAPALPPVSLDYNDAPIHQVLEELFNGARQSYVIDVGVSGTVTLKVSGIPFEDALRLVLLTAPRPLTYVRENGVYVVKAKDAAPRAQVAPPDAPASTASMAGVRLSMSPNSALPVAAASAAAAPVVPAPPAAAEMRVTIKESLPARILIAQMLDGAGMAYVIGTAVSGDVTVNLSDVPFDRALRLVLSACEPRLTSRQVDGVYLIERAAATSVPAATPAQIESASATAIP